MTLVHAEVEENIKTVVVKTNKIKSDIVSLFIFLIVYLLYYLVEIMYTNIIGDL